ncbi:protein-tyrosine phosphatase family protein [Neisseria wadsworthii]|uniref:hypothetical protein n=1 Tax=Neisseria wadsworthii TaxID=607711 RepID=UPI003989E1E9
MIECFPAKNRSITKIGNNERFPFCACFAGLGCVGGCSKVRQLQDAAIYGWSRWAVPVKQDANLYKVDARLYRSEQLVRDDIAQIERLGIQSIVNLRFFDRNDDRQLLEGRGST